MIHNIGFISLAVISLGFSLFVLLNEPHSWVNRSISLCTTFLAIFALTHVIGVNTSDVQLSRDILFFNITIPFIGIFGAQGIALETRPNRPFPKFIIFLYIFSFFYLVISLAYPSLFLLPSTPKMYFPNYYNPGPLNFIRLILLYGLSVPYMLFLLGQAYFKATDTTEKNKWLFYFVSVFLGFLFGSAPNFLVYGIKIDPLWGMLTATFALPLIYSAVKYKLFNVRIIAKQAFLYSVTIGFVGGVISVMDYINRTIIVRYAGFPAWIFPLVLASVIVTLSIIVWFKLKEQDTLKYEFITTVTHKFRTPLTHIRWAAENLSKLNIPESDRDNIRHIEVANQKLVELTDVLINVSEANDNAYDYDFEKASLNDLTREAIIAMKEQFSPRSINVRNAVGTDLMVLADRERIRSVMQSLLENAVNYGPDREISISAKRVGDDVVWHVNDMGIGIAKEDMPYIFTRFYRGKDARLSDTEGMGIGLFIAKQIILRHRGRIWAESDGAGKGSTFSFSLPAIK